VLGMKNTFVAFVWKNTNKAGRKMGHVTIMSEDRNDLIAKVNIIKKSLKVICLEYILHF
jgi:5-(carboxyamino)imidazole ribonucleotide synthase